MKKYYHASLIFFLILSVSGCATTIIGPAAPEAVSPTGGPATVVETFEGTASWYGPEFHGKKTASGEIFDMTDFTAAHKSLPMGTTCIVTNLKNDKSVTVRINDRGPFVKDRIIDLSYAAAKVVGMIDTGTAPVRVEVLADGTSSPADTTTGTDTTTSTPITTEPITASPAEAETSYTVQVGSFSTKSNAETLLKTLSASYDNVYLEEFTTTGSTYWRVRVGTFSTREQAEAKAGELTGAGYSVIITPK